MTKVNNEKIEKLFNSAKAEDILVLKEVGLDDLEFSEVDAQQLADKLQVSIVRRLRYDQNKNRVVFETAFGDKLLITQEVATAKDEFSITPTPKEEQEDEDGRN